MMPSHPLAEVFGFLTDDHSMDAQRSRQNRLCPYNNRVPNCTKDKANDPLGVCSIFDDELIAITCPIRFREKWRIAEDAAAFFFPTGMAWTSLTEVRLNDKQGKSAGNIDVVLVAYDDRGRVLDFGTIEVQAVYISGNVRRPFETYMQDPSHHDKMNWTRQPNYPRPDYLSSSRKRLAPQLIYKGGILKSWQKKQAVALHKGFFQTLPRLPEVDQNTAEMAWLIYDLVHSTTQNRYELVLHQVVYTMFDPALDQITKSEPGSIGDFIELLQARLDEKRDDREDPPDTPTLADLL